MTLVAAWVRSIRTVQELVVASDSRVSGGFRWDGCPKVFPLARSDALVAFAGQTDWSYPLMLQLNSAISIYARSRERALDLHEMKTYALRVFNDIYAEFKDPAHPDLAIPQVEFALGGWSWLRSRFHIWHCTYADRDQKFVARPAPRWGGSQLLFLGATTAEEAYDRLRVLIFKNRRMKHDSVRLNYEPFEVLRDMLRAAGPFSDIGGPPQVFKAYQHMNVRGFGVWWPTSASGRVAFGGRALRDYERGDGIAILDPDTLKTASWPRFSQEEDMVIWRRRILSILRNRP